MSTPVRLAPAAAARIQSFTVVLSFFSVLLIAIFSIAYFVSLGDGSGSGTTGRDYYNAWENPDPVAAERDGDTWSGQGQAVIRLSGLDPLVPLRLELGEDSARLNDVSVTGPGAELPTPGARPARFDLWDDVSYVVPGAEDVELWIDTYRTEPWSLTITPADLPEHTGTASGVGETVFLYTGDASAARVVTRGGSLYIDVVTVHGDDSVFRSYDSPEGSISWADSPVTVFQVETYDDMAWTITFFETEPAPVESPDEDEGDDDVSESEDPDE